MFRYTARQLSVGSADGIRIPVRVTGEGRPLVVCPSSSGGTGDWWAFADLVAPHVTTWVVGRRPPGDDVGERHEVADLAAVLDAAGPDAVLLGHADGGLLAWDVATRRRLAGLVLYEPAPVPDIPRAGTATLLVAGELGATRPMRATGPASVVELGGQARDAHIADPLVVAYAVLPFVRSLALVPPSNVCHDRVVRLKSVTCVEGVAG